MAKKKERTKVEELLTNIIADFNRDADISEGVTFNQKKQTRLHNLYTNSQFENLTTDQMKEQGYVFFNKINQALRTFLRKTNLDQKSFTLSIKDKFVQYLGQAGMNEWMDDEEMGTKANEVNKDLGKYGTSVWLARPNADKGNQFKHVDFNTVIWDQNDYTQAPIVFYNAMIASKVFKNRNWFTKDLQEALIAEKKDPSSLTGRIMIYEMYGEMPEYFITNNMKDLDDKYQYHVFAQFNGEFFHMYSAPYKENPIFVFRRNPIHNRSMGQAVVEEMVQSQIVVNEVQNLALKELRNVAKTVYQTTDEGLDGLDLNEIDDMTVIKTDRDTQLSIFPQRQSNFMALQNYAMIWENQGKEQSGAVDSALGKGEGTREPVGTRGYKLQEISDTFGFEAELIALQWRTFFKKAGGLKMVYKYFSSEKDIEDLLLPDQLNAFYKFVAKKLAVVAKDFDTLQDGADTESEMVDMEDMVFEKLQSGDIKLTKEDFFVSEEDFVDKTRIDIIGEATNKKGRIDMLNLLAQYLLQRPEMAKAYGTSLEAVIQELAMLSDGQGMVELSGQMAQVNPAPTSQNDPVNNQPITQ